MFEKQVSNAQIKHIRQLQSKKYRQRYRQFVVEGTKSVLEFVQSGLKCSGIYAVTDWLEKEQHQIIDVNAVVVNNKQLSQISGLKTPQFVVGVFEIPESKEIDAAEPIILALEDIRDPGNLGTIIRTADWFGLTQIVCSETCADCFNPKVVQASMGSLSRMNVIYSNLTTLVYDLPSHSLTLADMVGKSFKEYSWTKNILVIGNEAKGVSKELEALTNDKVSIPKKGNAESLNAALSAGILLSAAVK